MKTQPADSLTFNAIYKDTHLSGKQKKVKNRIVSLLKMPYDDKVSYEEYFEKQGLAFSIRKEKKNALSLSLIKNVRETKSKGSLVNITYKSKKFIGLYDMNRPFSIEDLFKPEKSANLKTKLGFALYSMLILASGAFLLFNKSNNSFQNKESKDVVINNTADSIKSLNADSIPAINLKE